MSNIYRISQKEPCEICVIKAERLHDLEMHDQDEDDLSAYAWAVMVKLLWLGIMLGIVGGGSAMVGFKALETWEGNYGTVAAITIWLFGAYVFINAIFVTFRYHSDKKILKKRLDELQSLRRHEFRERQNARREEERKKKEKTNVG